MSKIRHLTIVSNDTQNVGYCTPHRMWGIVPHTECGVLYPDLEKL
jgi:hypothetical protein